MNARRLTLLVLATALGVLTLALGAGPALAIGPPVIEGESFSNVGSTEASVSAQINPEGVTTTYHVAYVTGAQFQAHGYAEATDSPVPDAELPAGGGSTGVRVALSGLLPGMSYHFRFVAANAQGLSEGADEAFTSLTPGILGLPDERGYEMVTPPINQ